MIRYISKEERDMAQSILIVDDERDIVSMLNQYFCKIGYVVYTAINGKEALNAITKHPDIILLDINMPDMNGFTICDKIKGFAVGGDDYVVKPFSVDELEARVAAHLRREKRHGSSAIVQFDNNIVIDYSSRVVFYRNAEINFTKKEFDIIEFLSQNKGIIFDRETIYEKVWGLDGSGDNSVITEHIRRIRTKFLSIGDNPYIETVWGCGYKWKK